MNSFKKVKRLWTPRKNYLVFPENSGFRTDSRSVILISVPPQDNMLEALFWTRDTCNQIGAVSAKGVECGTLHHASLCCHLRLRAACLHTFFTLDCASLCSKVATPPFPPYDPTHDEASTVQGWTCTTAVLLALSVLGGRVGVRWLTVGQRQQRRSVASGNCTTA